MSKSLARVVLALAEAGEVVTPLETPAETRTAPQAATEAGCALNQIVKSILLQGQVSGHLYLFLTSGGHQVDTSRASALAGEALGRADPDTVRRITGFAIGGVAPLGHLTPLPVWMDETLLTFDQVWAAAGTPRHIFAIEPFRLSVLAKAKIATFILE